jgi:hypothetical protein
LKRDRKRANKIHRSLLGLMDWIGLQFHRSGGFSLKSIS